MPQKRTGKSRDSEQARWTILAAAIRALRRVPAATLTVDAIAREAGHAKGLVHYHFKTKSALFAAAAEQIWRERAERWTEALATDDPKAAIAASWKLLTAEVAEGVTRACTSLSAAPDDVTGRAVKTASGSFSQALATATRKLFGRMGLAVSVPEAEIGRLAAAVVIGVGIQLQEDGDPRELEGGYAAFWAGMLSLTQPRGS